MIEINYAILIGNIGLKVIEQGRSEISYEDMETYVDRLCKRLMIRDYIGFVNAQCLKDFAKIYPDLCEFVDDILVFKQADNKFLLSSKCNYFRGEAPSALDNALRETGLPEPYKTTQIDDYRYAQLSDMMIPD